MIQKLSHVTVYTHDQEEAKEFYVDKLGLEVHTDANYEGERWLTLSPKDQKDFELILIKATKPETQAVVGKQSPYAPLLVFTTNDCQADYEAMCAKGVKFIKPPTKEFWGTEALFHDPMGNLIDIVQD